MLVGVSTHILRKHQQGLGGYGHSGRGNEISLLSRHQQGGEFVSCRIWNHVTTVLTCFGLPKLLGCLGWYKVTLFGTRNVSRCDKKNSLLNGFGTIFDVIRVSTKTKFYMKTLSKMLVILALLVAGTAVGGYAQDKPKPKEKEKDKKEQSEKKKEHKEHKEKKDEKKKEKPKS
jgi:hypothetical protein